MRFGLASWMARRLGRTMRDMYYSMRPGARVTRNESFRAGHRSSTRIEGHWFHPVAGAPTSDWASAPAGSLSTVRNAATVPTHHERGAVLYRRNRSLDDAELCQKSDGVGASNSRLKMPGVSIPLWKDGQAPYLFVDYKRSNQSLEPRTFQIDHLVDLAP